MNSRLPPRYLPTLTEVVYPKAKDAVAEPPVQQLEPTFEPVPDHPEPENTYAAAAMPEVPVSGHAPVPAVPDRQALAQQLIKLVQPQLEAELRSIAMELFETQFSALLPSLQLHIEEAVREALDHALPPPPDRNDSFI